MKPEWPFAPKLLYDSRPNVKWVGTSDLGLSKGLWISFQFIVIDSKDPASKELRGLASVVTIKNLTTLHSYQASELSSVSLKKNDKEFQLSQPKAEMQNDVTILYNYASYQPYKLLAFLKLEGKIIVTVGEKLYQLEQHSESTDSAVIT